MPSSRPARDGTRSSRLRRSVSVAFAGAGIGLTVMAPLDAAAIPVAVLKGHQLVTSVSGFAPGALVELRLDRVVPAGRSHADRRGTVHVRLPAPATLGSHQLLLVGAITSSRPAAADPGSVPGDDLQSIVVFVPRLVTVDFRVVASLGVDGEQTDRGHHGNGHHESGLGTDGESVTADTGTNVLLPALIGGVLVVLGAAVTASGRRRTT